MKEYTTAKNIYMKNRTRHQAHNEMQCQALSSTTNYCTCSAGVIGGQRGDIALD